MCSSKFTDDFLNLFFTFVLNPFTPVGIMRLPLRSSESYTGCGQSPWTKYNIELNKLFYICSKFTLLNIIYFNPPLSNSLISLSKFSFNIEYE